jgi:abequosyltransferase
MHNNLLSILIPTFNRAQFLDYSLGLHIPLLKKYSIRIVVVDNASTDDTEQVVSQWAQNYDHLIYVKHRENIGGILNFEYALSYSQTKYVWMLGDTYEVDGTVIDFVLDTLSKNPGQYDVLMLNLGKRIKTRTADYSDQNLLLNDLGGLMTCIAVSIIKKDLVADNVLRRYRPVWFTHAAIILEGISNRKFCIRWVQEKSVNGLIHPNLVKTNWSNTPKALEIACTDWTNFIFSLPPGYTLKAKMKCIMDFGKVSGLFSLKHLLLLRVQNILNLPAFIKYRSEFRLTIDFPMVLILAIACTPIFLLRLLISIRNYLSKK